MNTTTAIIRGSLSDVAARENMSIAETFLNANIVVLLDVSASMSIGDSRDCRTRYEIACDELARLQADMPGRVAVIGFSKRPEFAPNGRPRFQADNTDLAAALKFTRVADTGDVRFVVISDGEPDDETAALDAAAVYVGRIDCVYVGPEYGKRARAFLQKLASAHRGQQVTTNVSLLAEKIQTLLLTA